MLSALPPKPPNKAVSSALILNLKKLFKKIKNNHK